MPKMLESKVTAKTPETFLRLDAVKRDGPFEEGNRKDMPKLG